MPKDWSKLLFWGGCGCVLFPLLVWWASYDFSWEWLDKWATAITALAATAIAGLTCVIELTRDEDGGAYESNED